MGPGKVRLRLPTGEEVDNPSSALLEELILSKDQAYWAYQAGDVGLDFESPNGEAAITMLLKEPYGIFIQHTAPNEEQEFCAVGQSGKDEDVVVYVGGEPMHIPAKQFVSRPLALRAVEEFRRTGERTKELPWVPC